MSDVRRHRIEADSEWRLQARCRGMPIEVFFIASTRQGALRSAHATDARRICLSCSVRRRCLAYALEVEEAHGIWGGTTPAERRAMRKRAVS